jgi:uncharacterized protein YkwD
MTTHPTAPIAPAATSRTMAHGRWLLALLVVAGTLGPALPAAAVDDASAEVAFVDLINRERTQRGLPALRVCTELRSPARSHSKVMADSGWLHHNPNLRDIPGWRRIAENVGRGATVGSIHGALMNSDGHKRNILDPNVTQVGVGVERTSGFWVTQVFRQPASGAACTTPTMVTASPPPPPPPPPPPAPVVRLQGDFTGDGSAEVATFDPNDGHWRVAGAGSLSTPRTWGVFGTRTGWSDHLVGDFDGDGRDDVVSYHPGSGSWWVSRSTGSGFVQERWAVFNTRTGWSDHLVGDFDGDGSDDVVSYHPGAGTWWVNRSNGRSFDLSRWAVFNTRTGWSDHLVGDFDGDGSDDVVSYHPGAGTWWVNRSNGRGFDLTRWGTFSTRTGWSDHLVGDYDGDGRDDVASRHDGGRWWLQRSVDTRFELQPG